MAGASFDLDVSGLDAVNDALGALERWREQGGLADAAGVLLENSAKERIATGKAAPDGSAWPGWSERYAATRGRAQSLLLAEGYLRDSIQSYATLDEARVGSNLVYAGPHQYGSEEQGIPQREYLGVSAEDELELQELVNDHIRRLLS